MGELQIYTDGACKGNPGYGGWGVYMTFTTNGKVHERFYYGGAKETTNMLMETMAVFQAIKHLKKPTLARFFIDNKAVLSLCERFSRSGEVYDYGTHKELNQELCRLIREYQSKGGAFSWNFVQGHRGNKGNDWADALANKAAYEMLDVVNSAVE